MAQYQVKGPDGADYKFEAASDEEAAAAVDDLFSSGGGQDQPAAAGGPDIAGRFTDAFDSGDPENMAAFRPQMEAAKPDMMAAADQRMNGEADNRGRWATAGNALLGEFGDEFMGALAGGLTWAQGRGFDEGYNRMTSSIRNDIARYAERHPVESTALSVAGSLPTAVLPGGAALKGASLWGKVGRGAAAGAGYGAITGYGAGEGGVENRAKNAAVGAAVGGTIGGVVPYAGDKVGKYVGRRLGAKSAPTVDQISKESKAFFDAAEKSGVTVKDSALKRLAAVPSTIQGTNRNLPRLRPKLHENAIEALNVLDEVSKQPTIKFADIMTTRNVLRDAVNGAKRGSPDEKFASDVLDMFDDWRESLTPRDVYPGSVPAAEANRMLNEANRLWKIKKKTDIINDIVFKAEGNVGSTGFEKSVRDQFRTLIKNKSKMSAFSKDEAKALRDVANGGLLRKMLQMTSKVTPSAGLGNVASVGFGNPLPTAMAVGGAVARGGVNKSTKSALGRASTLIRSGGSMPFDAKAAEKAGDYATRLMSGGAQSSVPRPGIEIMFPNDAPVYR